MKSTYKSWARYESDQAITSYRSYSYSYTRPGALTVWSDPVITCRPDSVRSGKFTPLMVTKEKHNSSKFTILISDKNWTDYWAFTKIGLSANIDGPCDYMYFDCAP